MFKECPHPDENQRAALARELDLEPQQIKFWFQNRRTQMKVHDVSSPSSLDSFFLFFLFRTRGRHVPFRSFLGRPVDFPWITS
jgi:hypothetical protein